MSDTFQESVMQNYFDDMAPVYQERFAEGLRVLAEQLLLNRMWLSDKWIDTEAGKAENKDGEGVTMLDYACGTGAVSLALAPFLTQVTGMDTSPSMIVEYEKNAQAAHLGEKIVGRTGDLLAPIVEESLSDLPKFDLVAVSMALHHFENPALGVQQLARYIKTGGVFMAIDLVVQDHGPHGFGGAEGTISTHGFSRTDIQKIFEDAGLSYFDYKVVPKPLKFVHGGKAIEKTVFIARAQLV
ncbi:hypothetical protein PENANT_c021G10647 [Penicillium antarcticum]|uniref:Methyltransferase type 11 domain-containing protein n=1 Tax=Penicillium antarcticum TaxID=416450 RepID=A0A1V6PZN7_9EURO|nr:uncharacterized protein N7508_010918 [Penicillium antarcticum]KAJ5296097.1 hypothetical protein N7508_010918 [Penicillium antarcticum]OQD82478.1 hypothetical protein PENANT_c021G10647 [Penicillium antarcticum]